MNYTTINNIDEHNLLMTNKLYNKTKIIVYDSDSIDPSSIKTTCDLIKQLPKNIAIIVVKRKEATPGDTQLIIGIGVKLINYELDDDIVNVDVEKNGDYINIETPNFDQNVYNLYNTESLNKDLKIKPSENR